MKLKPYILPVFLLCFPAANAQVEKSVPGFLGSRNAVSIKVMPNLTFDSEFFTQLVTPNILISYERAISRRSSFTICAGQTRSLFGDDAVLRFRNSRRNKLYITKAGKPVLVSDHEGYMRYRNTTLSIAKSYYSLKKGSIAPQGKFFKLGLTLNLIKLERDSFSYQLQGETDRVYNPGNTTYNTMSMGSANFEFGSKRFISNHLFFQKGFAINIPFNVWMTSRNHSYYNIDDYNETNLYFLTSVVQTLNVSLAFGYAF